MEVPLVFSEVKLTLTYLNTLTNQIIYLPQINKGAYNCQTMWQILFINFMKGKFMFVMYELVYEMHVYREYL